MKKFASVLISIMLLVLINGLVYAAMPSATSTDTGLYQESSLAAFEVVVEGYEFVPGGDLEVGLHYIAGATAINFYAETSSGNLTTANVEWQDYKGNTKLPDVWLTSGTDLAVRKGNTALLTFDNPVTITSNVTLNILVTF